MLAVTILKEVAVVSIPVSLCLMTYSLCLLKKATLKRLKPETFCSFLQQIWVVRQPQDSLCNDWMTGQSMFHLPYWPQLWVMYMRYTYIYTHIYIYIYINISLSFNHAEVYANSEPSMFRSRCYISFREGISSSVPQFEPLSDVVFFWFSDQWYEAPAIRRYAKSLGKDGWHD